MWTILYTSLSNLQTCMQKHTHSEVTFYLKPHSLPSQWLWGGDISLVPAVQWQLRHPKEGEGRMLVPLFTCYERKWESFFSPQSSMWCLQCCFLSNDVFIPFELGDELLKKCQNSHNSNSETPFICCFWEPDMVHLPWKWNWYQD